MGVLNTTDARPYDIHRLPVGGHDVRNSSNSFATVAGFVEMLKWLSFDLI